MCAGCVVGGGFEEVLEHWQLLHVHVYVLALMWSF